MERMSGSWSGAPRLPGDLPLRLLRLQSDVAVTAMEELESKLTGYKGYFPAEPLEYAALLERVENATEEVRWIKDQIEKITGREERNSGRYLPGTSDPTLS
ncbi:hypothetical protein [Parafrankia elaeagni]|uniref:hypothetical protein n=1 Tax=Parafrankia elaeagni TaxID=222534 RepID=UPI0012B5ED15|nr:hypothetical protein [Parafrankia elaeagni]